MPALAGIFAMRFFFAMVAAVLIGGDALATPTSFGSCRNESTVAFSAQVAACSALITSGKLSKDNLALAYKRRGRAYLDQHDFDRAIADNSKAIELKPDFFDALGNRAIAYEAKGNLFGAFADTDTVVRMRGSARDHFDRASVLLTMHNYAAAVFDFGQAIKLKPDYVEALTNRAYVYKTARRYELALADLDRAVAIRPNATTYTIRGDVHLGMHNTAAAARDYTSALRLQPNLAAAYLGRAQANAEADDVSSVEAANALEDLVDLSRPHAVSPGAGAPIALQDLQHAIELEPQNVAAYGYRAILLHHLGQDDLALADYARIIALEPSNAFAYGNRAVIYIGKKQFAKAIADLDRAITIAPYPAAFAMRAMARFKQKAYDLAIADYSQALEMAPAPDLYLARSEVFRAKGRSFMPKARADIQAAMRAAPNSGRPYLYLGVIDYQARDYPSALKSFEIAARYETALDGGRGMIVPEARYLRGLTLKALGHKAEGQADIDAARAVYAKIDQLIEARGIRRDRSRSPVRRLVSQTQPTSGGDPCGLSGRLGFEARLKSCTTFVEAAVSGTVRADALMQRAMLYSSANDWRKARSDYAEAINLVPKNARAHAGLAESSAGGGDLAGGIAAYSDAVALEPNNATFLARRCWMRARLGRDLGAALADCEHALAIEPGADYLLGARGFAHLARKEYSAAISDYDAVLRLTPPGVPADPYALFGRGLAKQRLGQGAAAGADLSAARAIDPAVAKEYAAWGYKP
ncbi:MAG: tetratricopeptide repeat protein [Alphaproteobacteria bacterium]|nr:tetratricopeptide repeat protein [Alphaproteobacteria bacterium]